MSETLPYFGEERALFMNIFLTGFTGFIGGLTQRALFRQGHNVTCLVRPGHPMAQGQIFPLQDRYAPHLRIVEGEWTSPESWLHEVKDHDVVINTIGIIREKKNSTFEAVHTKAPIALFEACARAGVHKVVQISAMGADENANTPYHLSKRIADRYLAQSGMPHVVLRPSFVYGPGDHSMTFFARLAALPITPVPGDGQYLMQPLFVGDLTYAITLAVERPDLQAITVDVGGSQTLTFDALLDILARRRGRSAARKVHIPWPIMRLVATATDALQGRGPITSDELKMLRRGSFADNRPFVELFGFEPVAFDKGIDHQW